MTSKKRRNMAASVRARLENIARDRGEDFQRMLVRYAVERFLYRLTQSRYADDFILKGAMLLVAKEGWPYRPTRDLDLLKTKEGKADANLSRIIREICVVQIEDDGIRFDPASVKVRTIRGIQEHGGHRVLATAFIAQAKITLQIDVGYGDVVIPPVEKITFPSLLGFPAARIHAYPKETVIAEKIEALIVLGDVNSRMKDYYDFWAMSNSLRFDGIKLKAAIAATLKARGTKMPRVIPAGLSDAFAAEHEKMWQGFLRRSELTGSVPNLMDILIDVRRFLSPLLEALREGASFDKSWIPGGPWNKLYEKRGCKK